MSVSKNYFGLDQLTQVNGSMEGHTDKRMSQNHCPVWFLYQSFLFRCREFEVEILDREFDPPILVIQEGDRVWWYWDKDKVRSSQWSPDNGPLVFLIACVNKLRFVKCVYRVELPCASHFSIKLVAPSIHGFIFAVAIYLFSIS